MIFTHPLILLGVLALPVLLILLRVTPPAAKPVLFPPLALLRNLNPSQPSARHMPFWLLLLRLITMSMVVVGLAGPARRASPLLAGSGPVLLVIDNGWASAADWPARQNAARHIIAQAQQAGRMVALFATAQQPGHRNLSPPILTDATQAMQAIDRLTPEPWPVDRGQAAAILSHSPQTDRIYLADGITDSDGFSAFFHALKAQTVLTANRTANLILPPTSGPNGAMILHMARPATGVILARSATGQVLASANLTNAPAAVLNVPLSVQTQIATLSFGPTAGETYMLDRTMQHVIVGLDAGSEAAEAPFIGAWFFIRRALPSRAVIETDNVAGLIAGKCNVIFLADLPLNVQEQTDLRRWIDEGGVLVRFAGPLSEAAPDDLQAATLRRHAMIYNGTMANPKPIRFAPFPAASPFAGLSIDDAAVAKQMIADPQQLAPDDIWASLDNGSPIVIGKAIGKGFLVSILTSATTDWSSLVISGRYPALLARLLALGHGSAAAQPSQLAFSQALTWSGQLAPSVQSATLNPISLSGVTISSTQPPGLYGQADQFLALNVGGHVQQPRAAKLGATMPLSLISAPVGWEADLISGAIILFLLDLFWSLRLRGLVILSLLALMSSAKAEPATTSADQARENAALTTTLAYVKTGDADTDKISADGLSALTGLVAPPRTSVQLAPPVGVTPGIDPLNFYPLLYWPIMPHTATPTPAACTALSDYMKHGGLLLIDTEGGDAGAPGSGAGFAPGSNAALNRVIACLNVPPLQVLTPTDALAHSFYPLTDFPGRFTGAPVLIAAQAARDEGDIASILIGQNDWAGAWARDIHDAPEQTPIPGGQTQRIEADQFGVNLVFYALNGNYNAYQPNLPALLQQPESAK